MATLPRRLTIAAAVLIALAGALAGCTPSPPATGPTSTRPATTTSTTAVGAAGTVSDGHWVTGPVPASLTECTAILCPQARQIPPGTYQTTTDVGEGCYWWLAPAATADNPLSGEAQFGTADSGRPTVTVEPGTWWQVWRCGTWARID